MFEIAITVDYNDGDTATAINKITNAQLKKLRPVFEAIKNFERYKSEEHNRVHNHNWPCGDSMRDDLGEKEPCEIYGISEELAELVQELCPYTDYGFHTIERVEVYPEPEKERLV